MSASKKTKSSPRRIAASRANGAKSNGPITDQGRERVSRNALIHGLTAAKHVLLHNEDPNDFNQFHVDTVDHFQPRTAWEQRQTHLLANFEWTLRRAMALESSAVDAALLASEKSFHREHRRTPDLSPHFRMWYAIRHQLSWCPAFPILNRYRHSLALQYHAAFLRLRHSLSEPLQTQVSENGTRFVSLGTPSDAQLPPVQVDDSPLAA